ncbi:hypothetical protein [Pandoraea sp. NPDC087047]|uniref:hypothetical protein n=1 Tax=Pandoraea sp. NPDC087047 TaxID=3364390 RepID=UPI00381F8D6A
MTRRLASPRRPNLFAHVARRRLALGALISATTAAAMCTGCVSYQAAPVAHGQVRSTSMTTADLAQTDINRMATLGMRANLESLYLLADKLYKRNPREWRKGGAATQAEAMAQLRAAIEGRRTLAELKDLRDVRALSLSLDPAFGGDRVAAFVFSLSDTIITAHGGTTVFYLSDGLDAQRIYNAARNVEIAAWLLASRRDTAGKPLLLANEMADVRNVSFEREFGKIIGRLDLLAEMLDEKYRRAGIGYVQNLLGAQFLQFLPVR